jgi:molybdopterin-guanine dinucleotide biosynthesis protein A
MTSIILAGGKSSRLGRSKALQAIGDKSLIQWVIERLVILSSEIIIVTAHGESIPCSPAGRIKTVADIYPSKSPLVGIYSGLIASASPQAIVVGCDMPFLSVGLLEYMAQICSSFDVVVPQIKDKLEPLCAVYSKNCVAPIQCLLQQNDPRISKLFTLVKVKYVEKDEIDRFDPEHLSFFNINSGTDLARAKKLAKKKGWLYPGRESDSCSTLPTTAS